MTLPEVPADEAPPAAALVLAGALDELDDELLDELDEPLLHPAAAKIVTASIAPVA